MSHLRTVSIIALSVAALGLGACETESYSDSSYSEPLYEASDGSDTSTAGAVSQDVAEKAALAFVGEGRVTWVGPEDDHGAAWEIEITRPNGLEVDVLVAPDGSVIE